MSPFRTLRSWLTAVAVLLGGPAVAELPRQLEGADPAVVARFEAALARTEAEPTSAEAWLALGQLYQAHEIPESALDAYRRATELSPGEARPWYLLAWIHAELGELEQAIATLDHVAELVSGYAPAHWRRGRWLAELGRTGEAEVAFRRAVDIDPACAAGWVGIATILLERGEYREVIDLLNPVLSADHDNGVAGQLLGRALMAAGDETAGRRVLGMTAGMGGYFPDPWLEEVAAAAAGLQGMLVHLARRMDRGEVDGAIRELERLRLEHPADVGLLNKLGEGYLERGNVDSALAAFESALAADPTQPLTLVHLAQSHRFKGELRAALTWAERALEANPQLWQGHFERAAILHRTGHLAESVTALEDALLYGAHQNPNVWLMKGDALIRLGDWSAADRAFEQATERFPFLGQAWVGLAVARVEQRRLDAAREALATAGQLQAEDETMGLVRRRIRELEEVSEENPE